MIGRGDGWRACGYLVADVRMMHLQQGDSSVSRHCFMDRYISSTNYTFE